MIQDLTFRYKVDEGELKTPADTNTILITFAL